MIVPVTLFLFCLGITHHYISISMAGPPLAANFSVT